MSPQQGLNHPAGLRRRPSPDLPSYYAGLLGKPREKITTREWTICEGLLSFFFEKLASAATQDIQRAVARGKNTSLSVEAKRRGTDSTKERAQKFRECLEQYVVHLLFREPGLGEGRHPQAAIAKRVQSAEAGRFFIEDPNWNRKRAGSRAPFYSTRVVRREVAKLLDGAVRSTGHRRPT